MAKRIVKIVFTVLCICAIIIMSVVITLNFLIDDEYKINSTGTLNINSPFNIVPVFNGAVLSQSVINESEGDLLNVNLKLYGLIPIRTVSVKVIKEDYVAVLGLPFGVRLYTDGVLVVDLTDFSNGITDINPAKSAGIKKGDYILSIDGQKVSTNEDVGRAVKNSDGKSLELTVKRGNEVFNIKITPRQDENSEYRAGMWVVDSSAGIGTLSFFSPSDNIICGLGHAITNPDTGSVLSVSEGEIVSADILSVNMGVSGKPGELKGKLTTTVYADLLENSNIGVFGKCQLFVSGKNLSQVALKQEISDGPATVICTLNGNTPGSFSCNIKVKNTKINGIEQNLSVEITDENLIKQTGGIVQGMSGSPIVQNGKLVGVITHVLVDDPKVGYGIFAERMLNNCRSLRDDGLNKEAS